jgi:hypothetical protein
MDDHVLVRLEFEMGDIERPDGVHGGQDGAIALLAPALGPEFLTHLPQGSQDTGAVEALPLTVFAKAHVLESTSKSIEVT